MEKDLSEIQAIVRGLETENHNLVCENEYLNQKFCKLREKTKELDREGENEKKQLISELRRAAKELESSKKENLQLRKKYDALEELIVQKEAFIRRMGTEIKDFKLELTDARNAVDDIREENSCLKQELQEYQLLLEESKSRISACKKSKQKEKEEKLHFQHLCKKFRLCIEQTEGALCDAKEDAQSLKDELLATQEQNRLIKIESVHLADEMYSLKKKINYYRKEWEISQQKLIHVKTDYDHYRANIEKLKNQVSGRQRPNQSPRTCFSAGDT